MLNKVHHISHVCENGEREKHRNLAASVVNFHSIKIKKTNCPKLVSELHFEDSTPNSFRIYRTEYDILSY